MAESNLTNIKESVEAAQWRVEDGLLKPTPTEITKFCVNSDSLGFRLPPAAIKETVEHLSGALHRWVPNSDGSEDVLILGSTNSGKTLLTKLVFNEEAVRKRIGLLETPEGEVIDIMADEDVPDKTKSVIRVPFDSGFSLWDTPGFYGDYPAVSNQSRALLGLDQHGQSVSKISFIDAGSLPLKNQNIPVESMESIFPTDTAVVLFLVDLTMTPLGYISQIIKQDIADLRCLYGERLLVVGSFADKYYDVWDQPTREVRCEIWKDVLGTDVIEYSGKTKAGLTEVVRRILRAGGSDASHLLKYLNAEAKGSRFQHSLHDLSMLLSSGIAGNSTENTPYSDLKSRLLVTSALYLQINYSVPERRWLELNGDFSDIISQDGKVLDYKETNERRKAYGFCETVASWFGKEYYMPTTTQWWIEVSALAEVCTALYGVIHELEKIQSPIVEASKAKQWFASEFAKRNVAATIQNGEAKSLQLKLEDVWVEMFREHHPNTLDLATRLG